MSLIYKGSVKDIYDQGDFYEFLYSDRYSIFDWGEMPDAIPEKGKCLATFAKLFFEVLTVKGYKTHYLSSETANSIRVKKFKVIRPEWNGENYNYADYLKRPTQALVPLEVIFRFKLGQGNSLASRIQKNPEYLSELGFASLEELNRSLEDTNADPLVEVSTKLESRDRYLNSKELSDMNVLSSLEKQNLYSLTKQIAKELKNVFSKMNCELLDGKFEFAFGDIDPKTGARELILVDSIGPDELRLVYDGQPLSKEFLRQLYTNSDWANSLVRAKGLAQERKAPDWKNICLKELKSTPNKLNSDELKAASGLYLALTSELQNILEGRTGTALKEWSLEAQKIVKGHL